MKQKAHFFLVIFSFIVCCGAFGQSNTQPPIPLTNFEFTHSAALSGRGIALTQIGSKGFFYAQVIVGYGSPTAIQRVSFDGSDVTRYDVGRISRPMYLSGRSPFIESFCVGKEGSVNVLTDWYKGQLPGIFTIVVFDADGSVSGIIPVPLKNAPQVMHFAQFGDGRYLLVAGHLGAGFFNRVDAMLISSTGKVLRQEPLRKLSSAEEKVADRDVIQEMKERQAAGSKHSTDPTPEEAKHDGKGSAARPDHAMAALFTQTVLVRGDDGNIYMARPDHPRILYRVSESGDMKPVHLLAGQGSRPMDSHTQLMGGSIHEGKLMLFYVRFDLPADSLRPRTMQGLTIKTYSLASHHLLATYTGAKPHVSPLLVGWDGNEFYFLHYAKSGQRGGYEIEKATP